MALTRSDEGTLNPRASVAQYSSRVLGGQPGAQPLPRTVLQSTTPKIPYPAKSGSGASLPTRAGTGIFDIINQSAQNTTDTRQKVRNQARSQGRGTGAGLSTSTGYRGGGGNYSTAKGPVGARGAYGLEAGAGARLQALQKAYQQKFGQSLPVISGGRTYQEQARLYALYKSGRGNLAAPPGTSNHESGRAVDFGGPAHGYSPQQTWLAQNAPKFGWHWAGKNFSQVEPWHFEAMY